MLKTRIAELNDLKAVLEIIDRAVAFLAEQGSPQWQNGQNPSYEQLLADIQGGHGYVLTFDDKLVGYASLIPGPDAVYTAISEGAWLKLPAEVAEQNFLAIHRVAISNEVRGQGLAQTFMADLLTAAKNLGYHDVRIDTYPRNLIMQKVIKRAGFTYQGMIYFNFADGERYAYQQLLAE